MLTTLWQDVRFALRMLAKTPAFSLTVILTLGLALGANTSIFSLVSALVLRSPVGVADPWRVVQLRPVTKEGGIGAFSYPDFLDLKSRTRTLSQLVVQTDAKLDLNLGGDVERIDGSLVSGEYFKMLGLRPSHGRLFTDTDVTNPGSDSVAVISASLWRRRFNADSGAVGRTLRLNAHSFTVIGIAAEGFTGTRFGQRIDIWAPATMYKETIPWLSSIESSLLDDRNSSWLMGLGRLKPGVSPVQAQTELTTLYNQIIQSNKPGSPAYEISVLPDARWAGSEYKDASRMIGLLSAVVAAVLLIACANVANLMLARTSRRGAELAIRAAIGASRWRILRMLLVESSLLALLGGVTGLLIGAWFNAGLLAFLPRNYSGFFQELDQAFDWRVFGVMTLISLLTGVLCGLLSAWKISKPDLTVSLKEGGGAGSGPTQQRVRTGLVVAQAAISFILLVGAGLLIRTLQQARSVELGFNPANLTLAHLDPAKNNYSKDRLLTFPRQLVQRVEGLPGVSIASCAANTPLSDFWMISSVHPPGVKPGPDVSQITVGMNHIAPRYFETLGAPIIAGREFRWTDQAGAAPVAVINQSLAREFGSNENPIGKRFFASSGSPGRLPEFEVIGVVQDNKSNSLFESAGPQVYFPLSQENKGELTLVIRAGTPPAQLLPPLRQAIASIDRELPVYGVTTMTEQIDEALISQRLAALLVSGFGLTAVLLAALGIYGVLSYSVTQRTREIGVRMALGAERRDVLSLIIRHGMRATLLGVGLGAVGAYFMTRWLKSWLYGVSPTDPLTFLTTAAVLFGAALLAGWLPALRATRVDPIQALRNE